MAIEEIGEEISSLPIKVKDVTTFFERSGNLRSRRNQKEVKQAYWINDQGGRLSAKDLVYVSRIVILCPQGVLEKSQLNFTLIDAEGRSDTVKPSDIISKTIASPKYASKVTPASNNVLEIVLKPNLLLKAIEVKFPKKAGGKKSSLPLLDYSVNGYALSSIREIEKRFEYVKNKFLAIEGEVKRAVDNRDSAIAAKSELEEEQRELVSENQAYGDELEGSKKQVENINEEIKKLIEKKGQLDETLKSSRVSLEEARNNNQQLSQDNKRLNEEISDKDRELRQLEADRNILSDEYRDYVEEGRSQSAIYYWMIGGALVITLVCSSFLVVNAYHYLSNAPLGWEQTLSLIMQRSPFVIGALAIAGASAGFAKYMFDTVININKKRLDLTKLLILAKEVSFSSNSDGLVNNEVVYRERIRLKLEMLKSHLLQDIGQEGLKARMDEISSEVIEEQRATTSSSSSKHLDSEDDSQATPPTETD